ncbi:MAG: hypothetical protein GY719_23485 [bacterium]|nr:hypothetical protein [bacterium]
MTTSADPSAPLRDQRALPWLLAALCLLYLLPVLLTPHLPMQDLPNHLAIVDALARQEIDPGWSEHFASRLGLRPYAAYYGLALPPAKLLGPSAANRLVLALYVAGFIAAASFLVGSLRHAGRWCVLLFFPLIYNDFYLVGLVNFLLAIPLAMLGAGASLRLLAEGRRRTGYAVLLGAVALLVYWTHPLALVMLLAVIAAVALRATTWRARAVLGIALAPAAVLLLGFTLQTAKFGGSAVWLSATFKATYLALSPLMFVEAADRVTFWISALILGILLVAGARRAITAGGRGRSPWILAGVLLVLYLACPFVLGSTVWSDARVAFLFWIALLCALSPHLLATRAEKLAAVALCLLCLVGVQRGHRAFSAEIEPLFEVIDQSPPAARFLSISFDQQSRVVQPFYARRGDIPFFSLHVHTGAYYHLARGGVSPFMTFWAGLPWLPLELKNEVYETAFAIGDPFAPGKLLQKLPRLDRELDLVLTRGAPPRATGFLEAFAAPAVRVEPYTLFVMNHRLPPAREQAD